MDFLKQSSAPKALLKELHQFWEGWELFSFIFELSREVLSEGEWQDEPILRTDPCPRENDQFSPLACVEDLLR